MTTADFYAQTALQYGQCEIEKGITLYSPAGMKALQAKDQTTGEPFDHTAADYWIITGHRIIAMYGAENITDFLNEKENSNGYALPINYKAVE